MTVIGKASIDIRANDKFFERDVKKMARGIKDIVVDVKADVQISAVTKKLNDFRRRQEKRILNLQADISTDLVENRIEKIWEDNDGRTLNMNLDFDHTSAWRALARVKESAVANSSVTLNAELDTDDLYRQMEHFIDEFEGTLLSATVDLATGEAASQFETFQTIAERNGISVDAKAETLSAEAQLALLARDRRAFIHVGLGRNSVKDLENILAGASSKAFRMFKGGGNPIAQIFRDPQISKAIEGFSYATAGLVPPHWVKDSLSGLMENFEAIALKAGLVTTAIGGIGSAVTTAVGFASRLVVDLGEIIGLAAVAPAAFVGFRTTITALNSAWEGFSDALIADPLLAAKAIDKIYKPAQNTARALHQIVFESDRAVKSNYWDAVGDSVERMAKLVKGDIVGGMGGISKALGSNTTAVANVTSEFAKAGGIEVIFDNIVASLQNAVSGSRDFADALLTITEEGSKRLPMFGEWFSEMGEKFNDFIQISADSGAILTWIDQGVQRLQELGTIALSTGRIFGSIAEAAEDAGIGGLTELAGGFEKVADALATFRAQAAMRDLFRDGSAGVEMMSEGLGALLSGVESALPQIGDIFLSTSDTIGLVMEQIGHMIEHSGMMDGLVALVDGVHNAASQMGPAFDGFGNIIGHLGEMFGQLVESMAPGFNTIMTWVDGFLANFKQGWMDLVPVLNDVVHIFSAMLTGPIHTAGALLGGIAGIIALIPAPLTATATAAIAAGVGFTKIVTAMKGIKTVGAFSTTISLIGTALSNLNGPFSGFHGRLGTFKSEMKSLPGAVTNGFKGVGGSIMSALGGPIGLAITAVTAAVAGLVINAQENARKYKESVSGYADAWDPVTQKFSSSIEDIQRQTDRFADMKVGTLFSNFKDELEDAGISAEDFARRINDMDASSLGKITTNIDEIKSSLMSVNDLTVRKDLIGSMISDESLAALGKTREEFNKLSVQDMTTLIGGLDEVATEAEEGAKSARTLKDELENLAGVVPDNLFKIAESGSQGLRDALEGANTHAGTLVQNFDTLRSSASTVEQKTSAMKSNLELMGLDTSSWNDPLRQMAQTAEDNTDAFKELKETAGNIDLSNLMTVEETFGGAQHAVLNFNGEVSKVSTGIHDIMSQSAESIHSVAAGAFDQTLAAGKGTAEAVSAAVSATQPHIESLVKSLQDFGIPDDEIYALLDTFGMIPEDIQTSLNVDGVDTAIQQMLQVELAAQAIESGDWTAYLQVMDQEALATLKNFAGGADNIPDIKKRLELDDAEFQALMIEIATAEHPLKVVTEIDALDMNDKLAAMLGQAQTIKARVEADTTSVDEALSALEGFPEFVTTYIETEGDLGVFEGQINEMLAWVEGLTPEIKATPEVQAFMQEIEGLKGEIEANPVTQKIDGESSAAVEEGNRAKDAIEQNKPEVSFDANSNAVTAEAERAKTSIESTNPTLTIDAKDGGSSGQIINGLVSQTESGATFPINLDLGQLEHMRGVLRHYQNTTLQISANVSMGGIEHLRGVLSHYQNTNINVTTSVSMGGIEHLRGVLSAYKNTTITVTANANLGGVNALQAAMAGIADKTVTIHGNNSPANGAINHIRGALASLPDKTVTILGQNAPANGAINHIRGALASLPDKMVTIRANNSPANGAINHIRGALASLRDRTVTITTVNRTVNQGNNGMMMAGGVRTFANGGMDPRMAKALSRIQNKKENHVAQIAPGSNNYRIWGEAETGGEAYIPLSRAKRARSMAILEQVASHFGVALSQYADGGYNLGGKSMGDGITSFANGGVTGSRKAKEERQRISGLKVDFTRSAKDALSSFSGDIRGIFSTDNSPVHKAVVSLRDQLHEAVKSLGGTNKALANRARKESSRVAKQAYTTGIWGRGGNDTDRGLNYLNSNISSSGNVSRKARLYGITIKDIEQAQERLNTRLEDSRSILGDLQSDFDSARSSLRGTLEGGLDFGSLLGDTDEFGYRAPVTARAVSEYAKDYNRKLKSFGSLIAKLRSAGYNTFLVDEIANMGVEDGTYLANALLSDKSLLSDINNSFSYARGRWGTDSTGAYGMIGGMPDNIAKASANAMYGASISTVDGYIKGMETSLSRIESAGKKMADSLVKGFKKALGIKSPSRVFMRQADFVAQGLVEGLDRNQPLLDSRVGSLVKPRKLTTDFGRVNENLHNSGTMSGQTYADRSPVSIIVNPSAGMDEELIGNSAARELQWRLDER